MDRSQTSSGALQFSVVDVFTTKRYAGNPLAIVHVSKSIQLDRGARQQIAREFNLSESVFIGDAEDGEDGPVWKAHIHTTSKEISFAGHPTIGTACHLASSFLADNNMKTDALDASLLVPAGRIDFKYFPQEYRASAKVPHDFHEHSHPFDGASLRVLQPKLQHLPDRSPIASIVKGMTFILTEVQSLDELARVTVHSTFPNLHLDEEWAMGGLVGAFYYVRLDDAPDGTLRLRTRMMDFDDVGEDPATGSAATTLAAHIALAEGRPGDRIGFLITQGFEMGRTSDIGVEVTLAAGGALEEVRLSGSVVHVMKGELMAP